MCSKNVLDDVWFLKYGARQTDGRTDGRESKIQRLVPHLKESIFPTECNSLWDEKKENCKRNSLIKTLVYRSNIYYSKIYQRGNWKNNSSTLHLEVWTRYFRHRYSIKLSRISMDLKIIKPQQCSLERSHAVLIELKEQIQPRLTFI